MRYQHCLLSRELSMSFNSSVCVYVTVYYITCN